MGSEIPLAASPGVRASLRPGEILGSSDFGSGVFRVLGFRVQGFKVYGFRV